MSIPAVDRLAFSHGISGNHAKRMLGLLAGWCCNGPPSPSQNEMAA